MHHQPSPRGNPTVKLLKSMSLEQEPISCQHQNSSMNSSTIKLLVIRKSKTWTLAIMMLKFLEYCDMSILKSFVKAFPSEHMTIH